MSGFWIVLAVFNRTWLKVIRRPVILLLSFVQPMIWMLFFGFLFQRFNLGEMEGDVSYIDFLVPGVCAMTVLFGASQSGIGFIRDIQTGFLGRVLETPAGPTGILTGKIGADVSRLLAQALVVCLLGLVLGAQINPATGPLLIAFSHLALFAIAYASLSCFIALKTRSQESMASFVHIVNMPILFTSTALVPAKQMPGWLENIALWNPLSLVVDSLRQALLFGSSSPVAPALAPLFTLAVVFFCLAAWAISPHPRIQRN